MFRRLIFEQASGPPSAPGRSDLALFVGLCAPRPGADVPPGRPVRIDSWGDFERRFAWETRALVGDGQQTVLGATYLGAAVRSFFAQGGRRCYVVCADAPAALTLPYAGRLALVERLLPGFASGVPAFTPAEPDSWRGAWWLGALDDVSFVCLPDLADLLRDEPEPPAAPAIPPPLVPEQFVACSAVEAPPAEDTRARHLRAPRCDETGYRDWARAVRMLGLFLRFHRPDVQLVAALPMPSDGRSRLIRLLDEGPAAPLRHAPDESATGIASAWVQLAYPWLRTSGSGRLPEGLESPDGVLTGLLARNALTSGTFRSAVRQPLTDVAETVPALDGVELYSHSDERRRPLVERVSVFGNDAGRIALLADVTADQEESYRPAGVNRLVALLVREVRRAGAEVVFEPSGEATWARLRSQIEALLRSLYALGALSGANEAAAFQVRCDRTTMSQNDLDNGRLVCAIGITPAMPIEQIQIVLTLNQSGLLALSPA
ncbi:MAG TPA: phage tail sheath C-terminal domain-containing protein [Roseiflexaceae bacterium]|nr:phage tail sheath C-terminal domain-containing protein [Roseiflexaceae bacterium]